MSNELINRLSTTMTTGTGTEVVPIANAYLTCGYFAWNTNIYDSSWYSPTDITFSSLTSNNFVEKNGGGLKFNTSGFYKLKFTIVGGITNASSGTVTYNFLLSLTESQSQLGLPGGSTGGFGFYSYDTPTSTGIYSQTMTGVGNTTLGFATQSMFTVVNGYMYYQLIFESDSNNLYPNVFYYSAYIYVEEGITIYPVIQTTSGNIIYPGYTDNTFYEPFYIPFTCELISPTVP